MKRLLFSMAVLSLVAFVSCKPDDDKPGEDNGGGSSNETGTFTDTRDGKTYKTVTIGDQTWLAENLNYEIHEDSSSCFLNDPENCAADGRLYKYKAVDDAVPEGWHLPSDDEWKELELELGMSQEDVDSYQNFTRGTIEDKLREGGSSGLDLQLAGFRNGTSNASGEALYWTSTVRTGNEYYIREFSADGGNDNFGRSSADGDQFECSVRCIKD